MSMMSTLMTVMRKELRDLSRDRRTLLLTLLFGPLLYPVLLLGMGKLAESRVRTQIEQPLQIPTIGADNAPNLVRFLAAQGLNTAPAPKDLAEAIRTRTSMWRCASAMSSARTGPRASRRWWR